MKPTETTKSGAVQGSDASHARMMRHCAAQGCGKAYACRRCTATQATPPVQIKKARQLGLQALRVGRYPDCG